MKSKLKDVGEREVIKRLVSILDVEEYEDSASFDNYVISCDSVVKSTHIPREMSPYQIGKFLVNVNLSDIASMGAKPVFFLASMCFPRDTEIGFVEEIARGIKDSCSKYRVRFLGGDTKEACEIVLVGIAIGYSKKPLKRSGAKVGDYICVTGEIGSAAAGFYALINNVSGFEKFVRKALEPEARVREGMVLSKYANSCIDITDGLAYSIGELAKRSNVGALIHFDRIPYDKDVEKVSNICKVDLKKILFYKGGDYELLFTVPKEKIQDLYKEFKKINAKISVIGEIKEKDFGVKMKIGSEIIELDTKGYEAFKDFE